MPGKTRAFMSALRLGVKYGPVAYEAAKYGRRPAQAAAHGALTHGPIGRMGLRRQALAHAASLVDGSALRVFHGDRQVWVVFTGELPIATHPTMDVPVTELLRYADLERRIYPRQAAVPRRALLLPGGSGAGRSGAGRPGVGRSGTPAVRRSRRLRGPVLRAGGLGRAGASRSGLRVVPGWRGEARSVADESISTQTDEVISVRAAESISTQADDLVAAQTDETTSAETTSAQAVEPRTVSRRA